MKKIVRIISTAMVCILTIAIEGTGAKAASVPDNANLLNTYGNVFDKVGNTLAASEILDNNILSYATNEYNSITAANEMAPKFILGEKPKMISDVQAALLGYYTTGDFKGEEFPELNFETLDRILMACYDKKLTMRGHVLLSHIDTPNWFFKEGFDENSEYVTPDEMDKRMEFYIKSVINHVASSRYGQVVNEWDVVDDYLYSDENSIFGWQKVYGKNLKGKAEFVKKAFEYAYDALKFKGLSGRVKLFYNDNWADIRVDDTIDLINYINQEDKICTGIGIQSHLYSGYSIYKYINAIKEFSKAGLEIQITELDVRAKSDEEQAKYYHELLRGILQAKRSGAKITEIRWWGLADDVPWRKTDLKTSVFLGEKGNELLYSHYKTKKASYDAALQAYFDAGCKLVRTPNEDPIFSMRPPYTPWPYPVLTLDDGWYYIRNIYKGQYLTVKNDNGESGENVELVQRINIEGQKWYVTNLGNGCITLKSALGPFMLNVSNTEDIKGNNIEISDETSDDSQQFILKSSGGKNMYNGISAVITTKKSNSIKAVGYGALSRYYNNVVEDTYLRNDGQSWSFEKVE